MRTRPSKLIPSIGSGELALVERIRRRAKAHQGQISLGIGDDCALIRVRPGEEIAITTDLSIAGRHFRLESHPPDAIGHRTLARGLSDIAAMGVRPVAAFLSLGLPKHLTAPRGAAKPWIDSFLDGFFALAAKHATPLAGGDLAESSIALADIILIGAVPRGRALLRSGARTGDLLYVTGTLGGSAAGLVRLDRHSPRKSSAPTPESPRNDAVSRHLYPQPRVQQGLWLRTRKAATAAIDLSDGLSTDLGHLCTESGISAEIDARALPIHPEATLDQALNGGEDYELLFTASARTKIPATIAGVPVTQIGQMLARRKGQSKITLLTNSGRQPLERRGWQHLN
jgi:thiamine-monophosphate kinase